MAMEKVEGYRCTECGFFTDDKGESDKHGALPVYPSLPRGFVYARRVEGQKYMACVVVCLNEAARITDPHDRGYITAPVNQVYGLPCTGVTSKEFAEKIESKEFLILSEDAFKQVYRGYKTPLFFPRKSDGPFAMPKLEELVRELPGFTQP